MVSSRRTHRIAIAVAPWILGGRAQSSIAVAGRELFIRTHDGLWCIGEKAAE